MPKSPHSKVRSTGQSHPLRISPQNEAAATTSLRMGTPRSVLDTDDEFTRRHRRRLALIEAQEEPIVSLPNTYADGDHVPDHLHSRAQLMHAMTGALAVTTAKGRWLVPPDHALWIPAGTLHAVDAIGDVLMQSVYVQPAALENLPRHLHVVALTPLMRALIEEAANLAGGSDRQARFEDHFGSEAPRAELPDRTPTRADFIMGCLLHEIPKLEERPLGLPLPAATRMAALCRAFMASPSAHADIESWAERVGMSRRTFTRAFRRETGLSLSLWRQQACLLAALPRLARGEAVTTVALDLGYESVAAFTTMFRRMLGSAPKAYLKRERST